MEPNYLKKYPKLFEPLLVGRGKQKMELKHRILMAPIMAVVGQGTDGVITNNGIDFFTDFVKGGFANVTVPYEIPFGGGHARALCLDDDQNDRNVPFQDVHFLQRLVHAYDAKSFCEIYHAGCCMIPLPGRVLKSSSAFTYNGHPVKEMDYNDMEEVLEMYARAAFTAKRAGFDGIQLHFAHGWLPNNFLSPATNFRKDEFGGSVENRCRFPLMIIKRVREAIGDDMPIELRLNGTDGEEFPNGITVDDAVQQVLIFQDYVDMIHLCCGNRMSAEARPEMFPSHFMAPGHNVPASWKAKQAGAKIPIGVVGTIHSPQFAESLLEEGKADYILMVRQAIADTEFVNKIKNDREEDIRPCLHCNYCIDAGRRGALTKNLTFASDATYDQYCSVNPFYAQGIARKRIPMPTEKKTVAIIGGGVAGMQAAITASERGHKVVLYEKSDKLGGQLYFADYVWFKDGLSRFREYLIRQVKKSGAIILLNTDPTPEMIKESNPDAVFVAVGAKPFIPNIPGVDNENVVVARDVFGNEDKLGKKVVIIGGGLVGCEMSIILSEKGHEVTVVEMGEYLAANGQLCERIHTLKYMNKGNVATYTQSKCTKISSEGVHIIDNENNTKIIEADSVILSTGYVPKKDICDAFRGTAINVRFIGDCNKPKDIRSAVGAGWDAAATL